MLHGLLMILFITVADSAFIQSITQNTTSASNVTDYNGIPMRPECITGSRYFDDRPRFIDCARIIGDLPQSSKLADFHVQGGLDEYKLPWVKERGTCQVRVELNTYWVADVDSWMGIRLMATDLNIFCRSPSRFDRTGGSTVAGDDSKIKITLRKNPFKAIDEEITAPTLVPIANNVQTE